MAIQKFCIQNCNVEDLSEDVRLNYVAKILFEAVIWCIIINVFFLIYSVNSEQYLVIIPIVSSLFVVSAFFVSKNNVKYSSSFLLFLVQIYIIYKLLWSSESFYDQNSFALEDIFVLLIVMGVMYFSYTIRNVFIIIALTYLCVHLALSSSGSTSSSDPKAIATACSAIFLHFAYICLIALKKKKNFGIYRNNNLKIQIVFAQFNTADLLGKLLIIFGFITGAIAISLAVAYGADLTTFVIILFSVSIFLSFKGFRRGDQYALSSIRNITASNLLFLRGFASDNLTVCETGSILSPYALFLNNGKNSIEQIAKKCWQTDQMTTFGLPVGEYDPFGADRVIIDEEDWKAVAAREIAKSDNILISAIDAPGTQWEFEHIVDFKHVEKTIVTVLYPMENTANELFRYYRKYNFFDDDVVKILQTLMDDNYAFAFTVNQNGIVIYYSNNNTTLDYTTIFMAICEIKKRN